MNVLKVVNTHENPSPILAFVEQAESRGWVYERNGDWSGQWDDPWKPNPKALRWSDGSYPTIRTPCGDVQIALDSIFLYYHNGKVWRGYPADIRHDLIVLAAIVVAPERRRQGLATAAIQAITEIADEAGFNLELEATPMTQFRACGQRTIGFRRLRDWYESHGFTQKYPSEGGSILFRKHNHKGDK